MRTLLDNECFCCNNGCGETEVDEQGKSVCCESDVFIWDKDKGVIAPDESDTEA